MKTADSPDGFESPAQCGLSGASTLFVIPSAVEKSVSLHMSSSPPGTFARQIELHGYPFEPYLDLRLPRCTLDFEVIFYLDCNCVC